ncbi:hypothetical protein ACFQX9_36760 [Bradyrhizobium sp. GCM10028915]|uniref:hypothetical protein n=1 Tax=unclassified Bradyrhizobium TaxID=2631580 RepID=UPI003609F056
MNMTARLSSVDSQAWLADYSNRAVHPAQKARRAPKLELARSEQQSTKAAQSRRGDPHQMLYELLLIASASVELKTKGPIRRMLS